ncbi:MAG: hypothetical protein ABI165_16725 [Bryobacteraceae bacterium]
MPAASLAICAAFFFFAAPPFWESKPPQQWSGEEINILLHDSPWAQIASAPPKNADAAPVQVYIASAPPMRAAELELARRRALRRRIPESDADLEYAAYLRENEGKQIIVAVSMPNARALSDGEESRRMQEECIMKIGRKKYKITGNFPPSADDPYLRLIFPRTLQPSDKSVEFDLYIPGLPEPYRMVSFRVKDMLYKGAPAF